MARERPLGVTLIALLALVKGVLGILIALGLVAAGGVFALFGGPAGIGAGAVTGVLGILAGLVPALYILFAMGAFNLRPWAWWIGVIASGLGTLDVLLGGARGEGLWAMVIPIVIFLYLLSEKVRKAFRV